MKLVILLALAAGIATPVTTQLAPPATRSVIWSDLDLGQDRDVRRLDLRIARAAAAVCGAAWDHDLTGRRLAARCRHATIANAMPRRDRVIAASRRGDPTEALAAR